jgi:hypothetical protein
VRQKTEEEEDQGKEVCSRQPEDKSMKTFNVLRIAPLLALLGVLAFSATPALAETETLQPWWHLRTSTRPSNIQPGAATDDVQQVTLVPGVEEYELTVSPSGLVGRYPNEKPHAGGGWHVTLARTASAAEIEAGLEGEYLYGPGDVEVTNRQEVNGAVSYDVRFVGKLTDLPVQPIQVPISEEQTVRVKQLVLGRPDGEIVVTATNVGDASAPVECVNVGAGNGQYTTASCTGRGEPGEGEFEQRLKQPVSIADALPPGLHPIAIEADVGQQAPSLQGSKTPPLGCSLATLSCEFTGEHPSIEKNPIYFNSYPNSFPPFETIQMFVAVNVTDPAAVTTKENEASVTGAGAPAARTSRPLTVSGEPIPFGLHTYEMTPEEPGGTADTQAGSHPFQLTTTEETNLTTEAVPVGLAKDLHFDLPPGLIGDPSAIPRCTLQQFYTPPPGLAETEANTECPADTMVGVNLVRVRTDAGESIQTTVHSPVFNLEPAPGEPARFGFEARGTHVLLTTAVRTGGDYGVTVSASNISETIEFISAELTFWGVPEAAAHNPAREAIIASGGPVSQANPPAFLSLPTSCTGKSLKSSVAADSWEEPANVLAPFFTTEPMVTLDGCTHLPFQPSIKVTPDSEQASKPTGLTVDVHVNQNSILSTEGLAQSSVRDITVKLPAGVAIDPSSGDGLEACSEGLVGFEAGQGAGGFGESPTEPGVSYPIFSSYLPGTVAAEAAGDHEPLQPGKNFCPNASKIAEVTIHSPLLPPQQPVKGYVYLAAQESNPFSSVLAMYIVAEDPISGTLVKLPGEVQLCQAAGEVIAGMTCEALGQIVSTFENEPQLPFEDAELHFFGGERAPLTSPTRCGAYTTQASYTPWDGGPPVSASYAFNITSGPNGAPCPGAQLPFSPSLTGGGLNVNAGSFSPFDATMTRLPGEQNLQSLEVHLPPGLSGDLTGVEQCPEPQANLGECGPNSLIGETTVSVGVGGEPFTVTGGKFFLTGPYNGSGGCTVAPTNPSCAPFGITFEVPAKAGPYDFAKTARNHPACDCVLVRGKININPETAAITVTSNPPGTPDAIPTSLEGIPLEIQHVNAITTRNNFQFNPTNCNKMEVTGTIHSSEGGADTIGVPFQVTNCAALKFEPKVAISTQAKTSKADGASLTYKLTYPNVPQGTDADIHYVKVELPVQLPSRLTTLQKACTQAQFRANPAGCPSASVIGHAKANVPNIPVPLEGPVYFVSNGGEAFPNLVIVLQGYNVTIDLVGDTFISKSGITSTTFKTVPDNPVYAFEVTLPEGPFSALAANGNLCKETTTKLVSKKVKVKVKGKEKTETKKVKETVAASLQMPNEYIAQNGAKVNTTVPISVTGCSKAKPAKKATKKKKKGKKGGKKK